MGIYQLPRAHPQRTTQSAVMIPYLFPTCNSTVPFIYLFLVLRIIYLLRSIECLIKDGVFTKWKYLNLSINIVWKDYSVSIFSKVVSCSWRCGCHRPKTTIIKWTFPLILTSNPILYWGFLLTTVWLPHCQLWAHYWGSSKLTWCYHYVLSTFDLEVTRSLITRLGP